MPLRRTTLWLPCACPLLVGSCGRAPEGGERPQPAIEASAGLPAAGAGPVAHEESGSRPDSDPADPLGWTSIDAFEGQPVDIVRTFHPDGKLQRIACHLAGERGPGSQHGPDWEYFDNGVPQTKQLWRRGELEGPFAVFWPSGILRQEGTYRAGKRHGRFTQYFRTGDRQLEYEYDQGVPHGTWREWFVGGMPALEEHYAQGKLSGLRRVWERPDQVAGQETTQGADSVLQLEETYLDGSLEGAWSDYWVTTGALRRTGVLRAGLKEGTWRAHHEDGALKAEREFAAGVQHGREVLYDEQGRRIAENQYAAGLQEGPQRSWYADGGLQSEGEMHAGVRQGRWSYFHPDGTPDPTWSGTYLDGERIGD